jgi:predicted NBD/HSP70 family sugar kinase/predicted XRE-type DNA-binding protein
MKSRKLEWEQPVRSALRWQLSEQQGADCMDFGEDKAANNLQVRNTNKKRVINLLYQHNDMTKQEIAKFLELSIPTVSQILKELFGRGLVRESGTLASSGGRKPVLNALVLDAKLSLGIEITQNHISFVLIDLEENALCYQRRRERFINEENYFKKLGELTERFLTENDVDKTKLLGVGIAVPGIVQTQKGVLEYIPTLGVKNLPIASLTKYLNYPVKVGNEANLAGFAEIWQMEQLSSAVFLSINKGVGGAIMINDKIYDGFNCRSGEFGHITVVKDGRDCACGKKGCFEAYCSTKVLTDKGFGELDKFFDAVEKGDKQALKKWETYLDYLATGINNIRMIFDADIILGGEIDQYIKKYIVRLSEKLAERNPFSDKTNYLHISRYGEKASVIGAALLLVDEFLNS